MTTKITSLNDLIAWNLENTEGERRRFLFRGVSDSSFKLIPKISRSIDSTQPVTPDVAIDRFKKLKEYLSVYLPAYGFDFNGFELNERLWKQLFVAQHYGAPTNLLDFTRNPAVAAFFASQNAHSDGRIYAVQIHERSQSRDFNIVPYGDIVKKDPFKMEETFFFVVPPKSDKRILAQVSVFAFCRPSEVCSPLDNLGYIDPNFHDQPGALHIFEIAKSSKQKILEELNKVGINSLSLFPDVGGLGSFLEWKLLTKYR